LNSVHRESSRRWRCKRSVSRQCARSGAKNPSQRPRPWPNADRLQSLQPPLLGHKHPDASAWSRWSDDKDSHAVFALRPHKDTEHTVIREGCALPSVLHSHAYSAALSASFSRVCLEHIACSWREDTLMCGTKIRRPCSKKKANLVQ
jgi:hypothetical protein